MVRSHLLVSAHAELAASPSIFLHIIRKEISSMDKDRIKGSANQAKGSIKEAAGKVQNAVGGLKDTLRGK